MGGLGQPDLVSLAPSACGLWLPTSCPDLFSYPSLNVSSSDDHKPIWMHAEEREEMSRVSGGRSLGAGGYQRLWLDPCVGLAPDFSPQPSVYSAFPAPACTLALRPPLPSIFLLPSPEPAPGERHTLRRVRRVVQGLQSEQVSGPGSAGGSAPLSSLSLSSAPPCPFLSLVLVMLRVYAGPVYARQELCCGAVLSISESLSLPSLISLQPHSEHHPEKPRGSVQAPGKAGGS